MSAENVLLGYKNRVDKAVLAGGSWLTTLPLSNLKNRILKSRKARSVDLEETSTMFTMDLGAADISRVFMLAGHNASLDATYRLECGNDPTFADLMYDSGILPVWDTVNSTMDLPWEAENWWSGQYTEEQREGYTWTISHDVGFDIDAQYWRFSVSDPNNQDGYFEAGRPFLGPAHQFAVNMSLGAAQGWETNTGVSTARSGTEYFDPRDPFRVTRFTTDWMSLDEGMIAFDLQRVSGIHNEVALIFDPTDERHRLRRNYLGRLRKMSPVEYPYITNTRTAWEVKESA